MERKAAPLPPRHRIGCGFLIVSAILSCVLLGINGLIVMNLMNAVLPTLPAGWRHPARFGQALVFVGPLVLLLIEWWICDVTIDWLRPLGRDRNRQTPRDESVSRGA
jgi:hypothetical protein